MITQNLKNSKFLTTLAIIIAVIFCTELILRGSSDFSSLSKVGDNNPDLNISYIRRGIEYIILNIIYIIWLIQSPKESKYYSFPDILKAAAIFLIIALISYPATSDIYLYLHYGLMDLKGINPFLNTAGQFTSDLSPFLVWKQSSTYGPVSQVFFMVAAIFTSINLVLGVYCFKIFCLLAHTINSYLIWRQLKYRQYRSKITLAYLLNPLLLFEQVANAHLDVFLCTALIVLIGSIKHRRYVSSILVIWLGFLTKTLPIIWLPLISVFLIRQKRWKSLLIAIFLSIAIVIFLYSTVLPTGKAWISILNPGVTWQTAGSLHNILDVAVHKFERFLPNPPNHPHRIINFTLFSFKIITYLSYCIYYAWTLFKCYFRQDYTKNNLILDIGWSTLVLFLLATPWYQPWYCSILLPITALKANRWFFVLTSITFCLSSTCSYYLLAYAPEQFVLVLVSIITVVPTIVVILRRHTILRELPHPWSFKTP